MASNDTRVTDDVKEGVPEAGQLESNKEGLILGGENHSIQQSEDADNPLSWPLSLRVTLTRRLHSSLSSYI